MIDDRDLANSGNGADPFEELPIEAGVRFRIVVLGVRWKEADGDTILGSKSEIDALQLVEAANEEPGADEEHECERELRDHEAAARAGIVSRADRAVDATPESRERGRARRAEGRRDAGEKRGEQCDTGREEKHSTLDDDLTDAREFGADGATDLRHSGSRERNAERAARASEREALDEELPNDSRSARSERGAYGELPGASGGAHHGEIRHVRTGEEENEKNGAAEGEERWLHAAKDLVANRLHDRVCPVRLLPRIRGREPLFDRAHYRRDACRVGAGAKAADGAAVGVHAALAERGICILDRHDPLPEHRPGRKGEAAGHHPDNRGRRARERDRLADDRRIAAEPLPPEVVREDDDTVCTRALLIGQKRAAEERRGA